MNRPILILGEALMDCLAQPDGSLMPLMGGSPYNLARAAALDPEARFADADIGQIAIGPGTVDHCSTTNDEIEPAHRIHSLVSFIWLVL